MRKKGLFLFYLFILISTSCSKEDFNNGEGRFDNVPFKWDYSSLDYKANNNDIFVGDILLTQVQDSVDTQSSKNDIFTINHSGIYIGAVYPKSSITNGAFDREITKDRNPIDVIFEFYDPFIDQITTKTESVGYKLALKKAIKSDEFNNHITSGFGNTTEYSITEFSSYRDIEKGFSNNLNVGKLFSSRLEMNSNNKNLKYNGRLFARLENVNFRVYMDQPSEKSGFFVSQSDNTSYSDLINPLCISSISYGRIVYVGVESEYSYEKIRWAIESNINFGLGSGSTTTDKEIVEIMNKSAVTILVIGDGSKDSYYIDGYENLNNLFKSNIYTTKFYGLPLFIQARVLPEYTVFKPCII